MKIEIITPDTTIFTGEASLVQFPGLDGSFEVMNNHAPLIAALQKGRIKVLGMDKLPLFFEIKGGVVEVSRNKILVLAE
jgi:F-type H+-transporting ATPase subunit epsilon